jgi:hypothetical protein
VESKKVTEVGEFAFGILVMVVPTLTSNHMPGSKRVEVMASATFYVESKLIIPGTSSES